MLVGESTEFCDFVSPSSFFCCLIVCAFFFRLEGTTSTPLACMGKKKTKDKIAQRENKKVRKEGKGKNRKKKSSNITKRGIPQSHSSFAAVNKHALSMKRLVCIGFFVTHLSHINDILQFKNTIESFGHRFDFVFLLGR